jgi:hypothetical protein
MVVDDAATVVQPVEPLALCCHWYVKLFRPPNAAVGVNVVVVLLQMITGDTKTGGVNGLRTKMVTLAALGKVVPQLGDPKSVDKMR